MSEAENSSTPKKKIRVWCDGCYDMVHFGHANQLRQAKQMGNYLVVGVHNDHEISIHKGPPVFNEQERYRMVRGIKWVDEVVENAPYETTVETLDRYGCDFCVHGTDGQDTYAEVKALNRYRECQRTPGVSTTDLVGRMLLLTRSHHTMYDGEELEKSGHKERARTLSTVFDFFFCSRYSIVAWLDRTRKKKLASEQYQLVDHEAQSPWTRISRFLPSTQTLMEFADGHKPGPNSKIVYVCGAFDLFHIGHLCFLEEARKLGDYLIVGIYTDQYRGQHYPIMTLHERVLSVLAYRPVNEVVIGAPYEITQELIDRFKIDFVVQGSHVEHHSPIDGTDCYSLPKRLGKMRYVDSGNDMTTEKIVERIIDHKREFERRNREKVQKEIASYKALQKIEQESANSSTYNIVQIGNCKEPTDS